MGSAEMRAYGLRPCVKAMVSWNDRTSLPEQCKLPVNYCRRIMGG